MDPAVPPPRQAMDSAASLDVDPRAPVDGIVMEEDGGNGILRSHYVESQGVSVIEVADLRLPSVATAVSRKSMVPKSGPKKLHASAAFRHKWLRMDEEGDTQEVALGKHALMHRLGVQIRDLRLLDAQPASSPPAILCREQAIVVNLEFIKCIITTRYVLIMQTGQEQVAAFVGEHQRRLKDPTGAGDVLPGSVGELGGKLPDLAGIAEEMPFELKVMEVVLDFVMAYMEFLTSNLEATAHPILDSIVHKVTRRNLEQLRAIKTRMVRLFTKVETIRELLERLLNDDDDMRDMNLSARARNAARLQKLRLELERDSMTSGRDYRRSASTDLSKPAPYDAYDKEGEEEREKDQVEQVLETYFMNLDNTYNKLQTLGEYVDDTEDYVRFEIDTQRNRFIEYRLVLQMFTFTCHVIANVANVFTMNLGIGYDAIGTGNTYRDSFTVFLVVCIVTSLGSVAVLALLLLFMRQKRMLCY